MDSSFVLPYQAKKYTRNDRFRGTILALGGGRLMQLDPSTQVVCLLIFSFVLTISGYVSLSFLDRKI